jgi:hypothetical protein
VARRALEHLSIEELLKLVDPAAENAKPIDTSKRAKILPSLFLDDSDDAPPDQTSAKD